MDLCHLYSSVKTMIPILVALTDILALHHQESTNECNPWTKFLSTSRKIVRMMIKMSLAYPNTGQPHLVTSNSSLLTTRHQKKGEIIEPPVGIRSSLSPWLWCYPCASQWPYVSECNLSTLYPRQWSGANSAPWLSLLILPNNELAPFREIDIRLLYNIFVWIRSLSCQPFISCETDNISNEYEDDEQVGTLPPTNLWLQLQRNENCSSSIGSPASNNNA